MHRLVAGTVSEQARHSHVKGVVVLDPLFAAQRVPDWSCNLVSDREDLVVGTACSGSGEDRDLLGTVDCVCKLLEFNVCRDHAR